MLLRVPHDLALVEIGDALVLEIERRFGPITRVIDPNGMDPGHRWPWALPPSRAEAPHDFREGIMVHDLPLPLLLDVAKSRNLEVLNMRDEADFTQAVPRGARRQRKPAAATLKGDSLVGRPVTRPKVPQWTPTRAVQRALWRVPRDIPAALADEIMFNAVYVGLWNEGITMGRGDRARCGRKTLAALQSDAVDLTRIPCNSFRCPQCARKKSARYFHSLSQQLAFDQSGAQGAVPPWFLTVTINQTEFRKGVVAGFTSGTADERAVMALAWLTFSRRMNKKYGAFLKALTSRYPDLHYFWVLEAHESGWPHGHLLLRSATMNAEAMEEAGVRSMNELSAITPRCEGVPRYLRSTGDRCPYPGLVGLFRRLLSDAGLGHFWLEPVEFGVDLGKTVARYFSKTNGNMVGEVTKNSQRPLSLMRELKLIGFTKDDRRSGRKGFFTAVSGLNGAKSRQDAMPPDDAADPASPEPEDASSAGLADEPSDVASAPAASEAHAPATQACPPPPAPGPVAEPSGEALRLRVQTTLAAAFAAARTSGGSAPELWRWCAAGCGRRTPHAIPSGDLRVVVNVTVDGGQRLDVALHDDKHIALAILLTDTPEADGLGPRWLTTRGGRIDWISVDARAVQASPLVLEPVEDAISSPRYACQACLNREPSMRPRPEVHKSGPAQLGLGFPQRDVDAARAGGTRRQAGRKR
jgi:hypothetical protein